MGCQAFIDESIRDDRYLLCGAIVESDRLNASRRNLRALLAPSQQRIHFVSESTGRRRQLLRAIAELTPRAIIHQARSRSQVVARTATLKSLLSDLRKRGVDRLVIDPRREQDDRDRVVIATHLNNSLASPMSYNHVQSSQEPLLWIPDAIAWAWGRGGQWRRLAEELGLIEGVKCVRLDDPNRA